MVRQQPFDLIKGSEWQKGFHTFDQVFLTGGGIRGSWSGTPALTTSKWSLSSHKQSWRCIIQGSSHVDSAVQEEDFF